MGTKRTKKYRRPNRPYQLIVELDQDDRNALEEIRAVEKLTFADTIRTMIRSKARGLRRRAHHQNLSA